MKVVVIGGVAAGMSAAAKIKRTERDATVHVYEKGDWIAYGACGLAYYVAGYIEDNAKLVARTKEQFEEMGVDVFLRHEAVAVDFAEKTVTLKKRDTGETVYDGYDRLLIATGAHSARPPIPGIDKKGIYFLKTMEDGLAIKQAADGYGVKDVVIVGGGSAGVETAEAMRALGKNTTLVEMEDHILTSFDADIARRAEQALLDGGVAVKTGTRILEFAGGEAVNRVMTDQETYVADMVVLGTGVRPSADFVTGISKAENGAILVDDHMRTSVPDVYAAGDCTLVYDRLRNVDIYRPLGGAANKCGRIAGANMCGGDMRFEGVLSSMALKVMDMEFGRTGLGEGEAREAGYDAAAVTVTSRDHAGYYPGSVSVTVKLTYEKGTMRILGAQLCGKKGAALRTDIFAVAIQAGMTTRELGYSDLIYSPPYSGVWDVVHIACNAAK